MSSNTLGTLEENPLFWAKSAGAKCSGGMKNLELPGTLRSNCSEANSRKVLDLKGEGAMYDHVYIDFQANLGVMENKPEALILHILED
ncbi:jupiter microtubule associated homolog 1-like [Peromyscus eremicus]|uniref:jupiter microtubule associated homolog 1-like n=1 Tax=Peromyscus eremicus TaxID=42410 RepID=UPI0027DCECCF|nr:jupiter microtubule associated homolog 1-like [Peromyscus eremicus]